MIIGSAIRPVKPRPYTENGMSNELPTAAKLRDVLLRSLPSEARSAVEALATRAAGRGLYAAGGAVRDLLLGRPILDLDLVMEGDAIALAREALPSTKLRTRARFGTASCVAGGLRIDIAGARQETYARPGALPKVTRADIRADLRRRDFSVNAIALRLDGKPTIFDPCGGIADVAAAVLRVLHDRSFIDDPTRIFRALRYAARLGFSLESHTARLLAEALPRIGAVGGERVRRELELALTDPESAATLELCQFRGALQAAHPVLHWSAAKSRAYAGEAARHAAPLPYGFALLAAGAQPTDAPALCSRLRLRRDEAAAVAGIAAMTHVAEMLRRPDVKPSGVVTLLERYPTASVAAFAMTTGNTVARQVALRYLEEWRHVRPLLSGRDLEALGVPAGPQIGRGLQLIRAARLDGWADRRGDERALAARFAKSIRDSAAMTSEIEFAP